MALGPGLMWRTTALLAICLTSPALGAVERQTRSAPRNSVARLPEVSARLEAIPFVGCPISEQGIPQAAPTGQPLHVVALPLARKLAYYRGGQGWGAYAPQ